MLVYMNALFNDVFQRRAHQEGTKNTEKQVEN